jgi:hypothetical protein
MLDLPGNDPAQLKMGSNYLERIVGNDKSLQEKLKQLSLTPDFASCVKDFKPYARQIDEKGRWRIAFAIEKDQNGETYHALIAAVRLGSLYLYPQLTRWPVRDQHLDRKRRWEGQKRSKKERKSPLHRGPLLQASKIFAGAITRDLLTGYAI